MKNQDFYFYENPERNFISSFAVNYTPKQKLWFVSHGFKLTFVDEEMIKKLCLQTVEENNYYGGYCYIQH